MKINLLIVVAVAVLAPSWAFLAKDPNFADVFRSDTTLGFMRRNFQSKQPGLKDLQHGPNYKDKEAVQATNKVAQEQKAKGPGEDNVFAKTNKAITKAGENPLDEHWKNEDKFNAAMDGLAGTDKKMKRKDASKKPEEKPADTPTPLKEHWKNEDQFNKDMENLEKGKVVDPVERHQENEDRFNDAMDKAMGTGTKTAAKKAPIAKKAEKKDTSEADKDHSVEGCTNAKGWIDSKGRDCEDYAEGEFCLRRGGYGDAWLDEWGKFEDWKNQGKSAEDACCVCGGGEKLGAAGPAGAPGPAPAPAAASPAAGPAPGVLSSMKIAPMPEQGLDGEIVAPHEDQATMTGDWGREFGPHSGHESIQTICKEHPENEWCLLHGFNKKNRSAARSLSALMAIFATVFVACLR